MNELFRCIVVGIDSTESSLAAGRLAIDLAHEHRSKLVLVYVLNEELAHDLSRALGRSEAEMRHDLEANGRRYLDEVTRLATARGVRAEQIICRGRPHAELLAEAHHHQATLLVVGRASAPPVRVHVRGRVLQRILDSADIPVLVVRQPKKS
ncbi:MAG: universal stress protein [Chloroflexota bacterium]